MSAILFNSTSGDRVRTGFHFTHRILSHIRLFTKRIQRFAIHLFSVTRKGFKKETIRGSIGLFSVIQQPDRSLISLTSGSNENRGPD
jgi:hypothetical protein